MSSKINSIKWLSLNVSNIFKFYIFLSNYKNWIEIWIFILTTKTNKIRSSILSYEVVNATVIFVEHSIICSVTCRGTYMLCGNIFSYIFNDGWVQRQLYYIIMLTSSKNHLKTGKYPLMIIAVQNQYHDLYRFVSIV